MKHLKTFEGRNRIKIDGNHVLAGDASLPQFWSENPDYTPKKDKVEQKHGVTDISAFVSPEGNDYNYLLDPNDHIDDKEVQKLIEPHIKKYNDFGFDPSK